MSCGGDYSPYEGNGNSVFSPEIIEKPNLSPLFFSYQDYYSGLDLYGEGTNSYNPALFTHFSDSTNIEDWFRYFDSKISREKIRNIVYVYSKDTIDLMLKNSALVNSINPLLSYKSLKSKLENSLKYLHFAKECEPFASTEIQDYWEEKPVNQNIGKITALLNAHKADFFNEKDAFLKQRYFYQLVRLFHFSEKYKEGAEFYEANKMYNSQITNIYYRLLNYVAGCYYKSKDYVQSNFYYAQSTPIANYNFFHPQEEKDLLESVKMCSNKEEKIKIWTWFGIYIDAHRAMKEIFEIDNNAPEVELLMVRSINIRENRETEGNWILGENYQSEEQIRYYDSLVAVNRNSLSSFILKNVSKVNNKAIWRTCLAMDYYLNGEFEKSKQECERINLLVADNNSLIKKQIRIITFLDELNLLNNITKQDENHFFNEFSWLEQSRDNILRIDISIQTARTILSEKYLQYEDWMKSELCISNPVKNVETDESIKDLIQFFEKPDLSPWEKYLVSKYGYSMNYFDFQIDLGDLYSALLIDYIYKGDWKNALTIFGKSNLERMSSNAFNIRINDCHDCDHEKDKDKNFRLDDFIRKLISMDSIAKAKPESAAVNYYLIANGLYNITYFGNCRSVYQTPLNNEMSYDSQFDYYEEEVPYKNERNFSFFDCSLAEEYYRKAAESAKDKEFAAKCNFMAAKCYQNNYYISDGYKKRISMIPSQYFENLSQKYVNTRFYSQAIKECTYFETYIKSLNK